MSFGVVYKLPKINIKFVVVNESKSQRFFLKYELLIKFLLLNFYDFSNNQVHKNNRSIQNKISTQIFKLLLKQLLVFKVYESNCLSPT